MCLRKRKREEKRVKEKKMKVIKCLLIIPLLAFYVAGVLLLTVHDLCAGLIARTVRLITKRRIKE